MHRLKRIQKPVWTLLFVVLVLIDFSTLPAWSTPQMGVMRHLPFVHTLTNLVKRRGPQALDMVAVFDSGTAFHALPLHSGPGGMLEGGVDGTLVAFAFWQRKVDPEGWWRPVETGDETRVRLVPVTEQFPQVNIAPELVPQARKVALDAMFDGQSPDPAWIADLVEDGIIDDRTIIWSGVALNTLSLLNMAALIWSLGWLVNLLNVPARRRKRRWRQGCCVACGYDLASTPRDASQRLVCPECGTVRSPVSP